MNSGWFRTHKTLLMALFVGVVLIVGLEAWWRLREPSLEALAGELRSKVEAIRGRKFMQPTPVRQVDAEQAREYLREALAGVPTIEHYWAVVRTLGLYRGPDREPLEVVLQELFKLAAGAYDVRRDEMLIAWEMDRAQLEVLLSHELCHALQDQHFDLVRYVDRMARDPDASADEVYARQAVVEGEATYVDLIYQAQAVGIAKPSREQIASILDAQALNQPESWESWLADPQLDDRAREQLRAAISARATMPPFLFEMFMSSYDDGARFIQAVHERGWEEVDRLYGPRAPVSTEQILHPEKWLAGEGFARIAWPEFDHRFANWRLLYENTLGERQWQAVFRAQNLPKLAESAAGGWNGDRFAVFRHRERDAMLLLMVTVWDSATEAAEFADAYRRLQADKYPGVRVPMHLSVRDEVVWIVEGGDEDALEGFAAFNASAQWYDSRP